jgi:hypothetical protein
MDAVNNMLELQMLVLENVHEDDTLFRKELRKSKKWLKLKELVTLKKWLLKKFNNKHKETIKEVLKDIPA